MGTLSHHGRQRCAPSLHVSTPAERCSNFVGFPQHTKFPPKSQRHLWPWQWNISTAVALTRLAVGFRLSRPRACMSIQDRHQRAPPAQMYYVRVLLDRVTASQSVGNARCQSVTCGSAPLPTCNVMLLLRRDPRATAVEPDSPIKPNSRKPGRAL